MKKILALAVGMLLIPFTAFGMEAMSDGDMDSITGQSGVAISLSNIQIYSDGGDDLWYETTTNATFTDGDLDDTASSQAVGIVRSGTESFTFINAIADPSQFLNDSISGSGVANTSLVELDGTSPTDATKGNMMLRGDYSGFSNIFDGGSSANDEAAYGVRQDAAVLSIRVVDMANSVFALKHDAAVTGADGSGFASVEIGLPTLEIYNPEGSVDTMNIVITGDYTGNPMNFVQSDENLHNYGLGTIYSGGESTTAILGGRVGITSYGQIDEAYKTYGLAGE